ncbi:MAG: hypothetical protein AAF604_20550 [Acidobacteriota bacterium]
MTTLTASQVEDLIRSICDTAENEPDCGQCWQQVSELAERELAGLGVPEALVTVKSHLEICGECGEEYELLLKALQTLAEA